MADVVTRRTIFIEATTLGDVAKWMRVIEDQEAPLSTPLSEPVHLSLEIEEPMTDQRPSR